MWIIPARAGFTVAGGLGGSNAWDHPRSRGVYHRKGPGKVPLGGSSPLARGLLSAPLGFTGPRRIIPARAGFTIARSRDSYCQEDHPRSRGVYHG